MKKKFFYFASLAAMLLMTACGDDKDKEDPKTPECTASVCAAAQGSEYKGNICVAGQNGADVCGCKEKSDCKDDLICDNGECKVNNISNCDANACKAATGADYKGNVCIDGTNSKICGCKEKSDCNDDLICDNGSCKTCVNDQKTCINDMPQLCSGNAWVPQTACDTEDGYACVNGECKCTENAMRCDINGRPQKCISGTWEEQTECGLNESCLNGECKCANGAKQCSNDGIPQECENGEWKTLTACTSGTCVAGSCIENSCAARDNGQFCDNSDLVSCENKQEKSRTTCGTMTDDYKGNLCLSETAQCGCKTRLDCNAGYICNSGTCVENTNTECDAAACEAAENDYLGNVCLKKDSSQLTTQQQCGCSTKADCKEGYICNTDAKVCEKIENDSICAGKDGGICDGSDYYDCAAGSVSTHSNCKNEPTLDGGKICLEDGFAACGCTSDKHCSAGEVCNVNTSVCVSADED